MSSIGYKPIFGRVLIKRDVVDAMQKTFSGIVIPIDAKIDQNGRLDTISEKQLNIGTIIAIGETVEHPDIQVGARVHWGRGAGANISPTAFSNGALDKGEEYFICMEDDILGILTNETGDK